MCERGENAREQQAHAKRGVTNKQVTNLYGWRTSSGVLHNKLLAPSPPLPPVSPGKSPCTPIHFLTPLPTPPLPSAHHLPAGIASYLRLSRASRGLSLQPLSTLEGEPFTGSVVVGGGGWCVCGGGGGTGIVREGRRQGAREGGREGPAGRVRIACEALLTVEASRVVCGTSTWCHASVGGVTGGGLGRMRWAGAL